MDHLATVIVLGFAAYRATQLFVWDTIGDPVRNWIELWHARRHESKVRSFVRQLVSCIYCIGFWLSVVTVLVYVTATGQWANLPLWSVAVDCWAVAGVQALLNRWDDSRPGHRADAA